MPVVLYVAADHRSASGEDFADVAEASEESVAAGALYGAAGEGSDRS